MHHMPNWVMAWGVGAALMLASCATAPEPFEYQPENELKPGAGVLTGEEGAWTIMEQKKPADPEASSAAEDPAAPDEETTPADAQTDTSAESGPLRP